MMAAVTAMAVLALGVASASASASAQWYVGGKALSGSAPLAETTAANVTFSIPTLGTELTCTQLRLLSGSHLSSPSTLKTEESELSGCKVAKPASCVSGSELDHVILPSLSAVPTKNAAPATSDNAILEKLTGPMFYFDISSGGSCPWVGEGTLQFGSSSLSTVMPKGQIEEVEQTFEISPEYKATYEGNTAYVKGYFKLKLASGSKWSFH